MLDWLKDFFVGDTTRLAREEYLYHAPHIITLVVLAVATIMLVWWGKTRATPKQKQAVLWVFFGILLFFEVVSRIANLIKGNDVVTTLIPMHFCSIMVWMIIVAILLNNKALLSISAAGGLIATVAFLAYPAVGFNAEVLKFGNYYSIISHSLGFMVSVFLLSCGFVRYRWKDIWELGLFAVLVYGYSFLQNFVWYPGSNYMYYMENVLPISNAWFLTIYIAFVTTYFFSFYIIYYLTHKNKKQDKTK